jgi:DNA polymerase I-like protein with 3'-5' exonuclease and polymerase domains
MVEHAGLEPWRVRQGKAEISSAAMCRPDGSVLQIINDNPVEFKRKLTAMLTELKGKVVYAHFACFDTAWCMATLEQSKLAPIAQCIADIKWRDTVLLTRWLINGQLAEESNFSYSLANLVKIFLPEHPLTPEFLVMKAQEVETGDDSGYWESRGEYDVILTQALATKLQSKLPESQRIGFLTECADIVPIANSWLMGIRIDQKILDRLGPKMAAEQQEICKRIGVTPAQISSPKQLGALLFNTWGLTPHSKTPTGGASTSKDDLMWIQYKILNSGNTEIAERMGGILEAKLLGTLQSKYIKTTIEALNHTGDGFIYGAPKIFGTYTGRMTYSNSTKRKFKTGIALHQIPRKAKSIREMLCAPEGSIIYEADASGQESRLMALRSNDPVMLDVFAKGKNFHSMTGSAIIGMELDDFEEARKLENDSGYHTEQRQLGKLTNLSCNFRIGGKALSEKAFVNYDTFMTVQTGLQLVKTFNRTYKGVPEYWDEVVALSKEMGYTEAFGGRRFKLRNWSTNAWQTESSAINVPIQGAGAAMKEIAILETYLAEKNARFALDLHDASFFYVPLGDHEQVFKNLDRILDNIDYAPYWGFTPKIPLPYESKFGFTFADVK